MKSNTVTSLKMDAEAALLEGKLSGMVALCYENERPPQGLAGRLDWRFHSAFSFHMKQGAVTGRLGEITYIPVRRFDRIYHFLLLGCGHSRSPGKRGSPPPETAFAKLASCLESLKLQGMGISRSDFGLGTGEGDEPRAEGKDFFSKNIGASLWIVQ